MRSTTVVGVVGAIALTLIAGGCEMNNGEPATGPVAPDPVRDADAPARPRSPDHARPQVDPQPPADPATGTSSDRAIAEQIRQSLAGDEWLSPSARNVQVASVNGVVTVSGRVETMDERHIVLDIAWDTEGVEDVIDELEVLSPGTSPGGGFDDEADGQHD